MKSLPAQFSPVTQSKRCQRYGFGVNAGGGGVSVQHTGVELTFFQQRVKLVEERREMDDDARTNDARDCRVD